MKKTAIFFIITLVVIFVTSCYAQAAPVYGGNMPENRHWDVGFQTNHVLYHKMKAPQGKMKNNDYFLLLSYGINEWLCFDGKIGLGDVTHKPDDVSRAEYDLNFAGGYGFRARLYNNEAKSEKLILGLQHISVHPEQAYIGGVKNQVIFDEWQASLLYAKKINNYYPYLGTKLSRGDLIRRVDVARKRRHPAQNFGIFFGTDYYLSSALRLNLEARFIDEQALSIAVIKSY